MLYKLKKYDMAGFDIFVYRLFYWRWNKLLANRPDLREIMIAHLKSFDVLDINQKIKIKVSIEKDELT